MTDNGQPTPSQDSASLLRRLAGASIMKAGLAKDQTEINRIIAEASKGSKFYDNEKRKDKDLTQRISKILKERDDLLRDADIRKVEHHVDQLLETMETQRDLGQLIVHVDMDAFYASVEVLNNPDISGKPFAVGHGVVSTASYEARKYGVRSGMPEFIAKKLCPSLVVVPSHFSRYMDSSRQVMDIFRRYDPTMQAAGCDEGYLNITRYCEEHSLSADACVRKMRDDVFNETKLTVSAGIAPNKMLAKICSDKNKPNGQFMLPFEPPAIKAFMHDLPIRKIPGVGKVNERLLDSIGIKTCGDIYTYRATVSLMDRHFGLHFLLQTYLGIASNIVQPGQREERKSIGAERTFTAIGDRERILAKLEEVCAELEEDMERTGWTGKTVTLKYKLDTYQVFTRAKSFDRWISTKKEDLFATGKELLLPELPLKVRLIGLRVTKLKDLREDIDSKPGSIRRFFEKSAGPSSPRKKQRADTDPDVQPTKLSQDGYEDAMPGYHEDEEDHDEQFDELDPISLPEGDEQNGHANEQDVAIPVTAPSSKQMDRKPVSSIYSSSSKPSSSTKPLSGLKRPRSPSVTETSNDLTCPICSKTMQTDNRGLNEHIDFCLSKGAIREAQAMGSGQKPLFSASSSTSRSTAKLKKRKTSRGES